MSDIQRSIKRIDEAKHLIFKLCAFDLADWAQQAATGRIERILDELRSSLIDEALDEEELEGFLKQEEKRGGDSE